MTRSTTQKNDTSSRTAKVMAGLIVALIPLAVYADLPVTLQNGTRADADDVMENFNDLDDRIADYEDTIHVDGNGNVGIGTTSPGTILDIQQNGNTSNYVRMSNTTAGTGSWTGYTATTSNSGILYMQAVSPSYSNSNYANMGIIGQQNLGSLTVYSSGFMSFRTGGEVASKERMRIDSSGNVGIGTTSPQEKLDVVAGLSSAIRLGTNNSADYYATRIISNYNDAEPFVVNISNSVRTSDILAVEYLGQTEDFDMKVGAMDTSYGGALHLYAAGNENVTVAKNGNVGIGTTGPAQKLAVMDRSTTDVELLRLSSLGESGSVQGKTYLGLSHWTSGTYPSVRIGAEETDVADYGATLVFQTRETEADSIPTTKMVITESGNVGIGTTNPQERLHVAGNVLADDYGTTSDIRLKTDIAPLEDALNGVQCLEAVTYRWADPDKPQEPQIGLIAQEVERCFPEVVSTNEQGYKSVAYARLVAPLAKAVKEQQQAITGLEKRDTEQRQLIAGQQRQIASLETRLARLEVLLNAGQ